MPLDVVTNPMKALSIVCFLGFVAQRRVELLPEGIISTSGNAQNSYESFAKCVSPQVHGTENGSHH